MVHGPRRLIVLALVAPLLIALPAKAQQGGPTAPVERLHQALLYVMRNAAQLGYEGRLRSLAPVLAEVYAYPDMARIAAGSFWKTFSEAEKRQLVDAFAAMSAATYAARFDEFGGTAFEIVGVREAPPPVPGRLVETRIVPGDGAPVTLNYLARQTPGGWRIHDVYYRGAISELASTRSQFLATLRRSGHQGLIESLRRKAAAQAG